MTSSLLPPLIVQYKPADADQRSEWKYEDLATAGIHVFYRQPDPTSAAADIAIDVDKMFMTLAGVQIAGVRVARDPDNRISVDLDATTGPGDHVRLQIPERLANRLLSSLAAVLRRSDLH